jgi:selenoprotein W-related protein
LTEELLEQYSPRIRALTLVPSDGGTFEVSFDGRKVFSRLETDRFPTVEEIARALDEVSS